MKKGLLFGSLYVLFIVSIIYTGVYISKQDLSLNVMSTSQQKSVEKVTESFKVALEEEKARVEKDKEANKSETKWKPSPMFVLTAVSIGAVADIIIILLWARRENRKTLQEVQRGLVRNKRLTDSNWFWYFIGMGMVRRKAGRLVVDWKLVVIYFLIGFVLKYWLTKELI